MRPGVDLEPRTCSRMALGYLPVLLKEVCQDPGKIQLVAKETGVQSKPLGMRGEARASQRSGTLTESPQARAAV